MIFTELQDKQPFNLLQETVTVKIEKTHPNKANLYLRLYKDIEMRNCRTSSTIYMHLSIMIANTGIIAMVLVLQVSGIVAALLLYLPIMHI